MSRDTDHPINENRPAQPDFRKAGFHFDSAGDEAIVSAIGEVDLANVLMFDSMLKKALLTHKPIRVDLTHCTYLDSTLINAIMSVISKAHGRLRITAKVGSIRRVFEIVGMGKLVPIDYVDR